MNIYVSNLSNGVVDSDLRQLFEVYGEVSSAKVITDRYTGQSRGFGFVEMPDDAASQKAIDELNEAEYDRKKIIVNEARPQQERPTRNFSNGGGYGRNDRRPGGGNRQNRRW